MGFNVYRELVADASLAPAEFELVGSTGPDVEQYLDEAVAAGVLYRYSVSSFNTIGDSAPVVQSNAAIERDSLLFALGVLVSGAGSGTVTSVPLGISCGTDCHEAFESGTSVVLSASPGAESQFMEWSGDCSGSMLTCTVEVSADRQVVATFMPTTLPPDKALVSVAKTGTGAGLVTSSPSGIHCGATCNATFDEGVAVSLVAEAATGSMFAGWSGSGCSGVGTCDVTTVDMHAVTATFSLKRYALDVSVDGVGVVKSQPSGVDCGADCAETFDAFTSVTLTAAPGPGNEFQGWDGACAGTSTTCVLEMTSDKSVTARFGDRHILVTSISGGTGGPDCTLRDAITAANTDNETGGCRAGSGSDTIRLPAESVISLGVIDNTAVGPNGLPSITSAITIQGNGATIERLLPGVAFRIFHVGATGSLTIEDATLRNGHGKSIGGGAVYMDGGRVVLVRSNVTENVTDDQWDISPMGMAILNNGGDLTITSSAIDGNGWNPAENGGATGTIAVVDGDLTMTDSSVNSNYTTDVGGVLVLGRVSTVDISASEIAGNTGYAMRNQGELYLTSVHISNNYLNIDHAGMSSSGVAYLEQVVYENHQSEGGGALVNSGYMSIANSLIQRNFGDTSGGGIVNSGVMEILNSEVVSNTARLALGGGIYNTGNLHVRGSTIGPNHAEYGGGIYSTGTLDLVDTEIVGNLVDQDGGGLYLLGDTTLSGTTSIGTSESANRSWANGGGVFVDGGVLQICEACKITGNRADFLSESGGTGGGIYNLHGFVTGASPETVFGNEPDQVFEADW